MILLLVVQKLPRQLRQLRHSLQPQPYAQPMPALARVVDARTKLPQQFARKDGAKQLIAKRFAASTSGASARAA